MTGPTSQGKTFFAVADAVREGNFSRAVEVIREHGHLSSPGAALRVLHAFEAGGLGRLAVGPRTPDALSGHLENLKTAIGSVLPRDSTEHGAARLLLLDLESALATRPSEGKPKSPPEPSLMPDERQRTQVAADADPGFVLVTQSRRKLRYQIEERQQVAAEGHIYRYSGPGGSISCDRIGLPPRTRRRRIGNWKPPAPQRVWASSVPDADYLIFRRVCHAGPLPPVLTPPEQQWVPELITLSEIDGAETITWTEHDLEAARPVREKRRLRHLIRAARRLILAATKLAKEKDPGWDQFV